jgi:hypothetical protein
LFSICIFEACATADKLSKHYIFDNLLSSLNGKCYHNFVNASLKQAWFSPTFSSLLSNRRDGVIILGAAGVHFGLSLAGLPGWTCPIRAALGIPCPGCGLTTATMQLLRGDIAASLQTHAFAPIFLFAMFIMVGMLLLPESQRITMLQKISYYEGQSGITAWVLVSLMLYWAFRLIA